MLTTLEPLDAKRKCFRQVGDVLVEQTVGEVLPALKGNQQQLDQACASQCCLVPTSLWHCFRGQQLPRVLQLMQHLQTQLEKKQAEILEYEKKYKIRMKVCLLMPARLIVCRTEVPGCSCAELPVPCAISSTPPPALLIICTAEGSQPQ